MSNIFYIHWNEAECAQHMRDIGSAGHTVTCHWSTQAHAKIGEPLGALVISLERLPSHGRAVADGFWAAKKRQATPIVFVGGEPSKVDAIREKFPRALFCTRERLMDVLKKFDVETSAPAPQAVRRRRGKTRT